MNYKYERNYVVKLVSQLNRSTISAYSNQSCKQAKLKAENTKFLNRLKSSQMCTKTYNKILKFFKTLKVFKI